MAFAFHNNRFGLGLVLAAATLIWAPSGRAQSDGVPDNSSLSSTGVTPPSDPAAMLQGQAAIIDAMGNYAQGKAAGPTAMMQGQAAIIDAMGNYAQGQAAVIDSMGNYEVNQNQARILGEQARELRRKNNLKQTAALLKQKKMWSNAKLQERKDYESRLADGRQLLAERRATVYLAAYRLPANKLNPSTGEISWPQALQGESFQENRAAVEELFRRHVGYDAPRAEIAREIERSVDNWMSSLRKQVGSTTREDYLTAQKFLTGLKYEAAALAVST